VTADLTDVENRPLRSAAGGFLFVRVILPGATTAARADAVAGVGGRQDQRRQWPEADFNA
jgi:hypothetical protein